MSAARATEVMTTGAPAIERAAHVLAIGGLVAFPTETVYGLGTDATSGEAVAHLYQAKGRPSFNPLIAHVRRRPRSAGARRVSIVAASGWPKHSGRGR